MLAVEGPSPSAPLVQCLSGPGQGQCVFLILGDGRSCGALGQSCPGVSTTMTMIASSLLRESRAMCV